MTDSDHYRLLLVTDLDDTAVRGATTLAHCLSPCVDIYLSNYTHGGRKGGRGKVLCEDIWRVLTQVDHSDTASHEGLHKLNDLWTKSFLGNSQWIYSTGRSLELYKTLASSSPLREPDQLITSVGTEIWRRDGGDLALDHEWIE